ncbi:MAG: PH domain-containing protein [Methanomicrobiales archaeon]|nr:PH domain-containing protein [Methanomicrobiales archaeon]
MKSEHFPLNTLFKPSPALVTWFMVDFLLVVLVMFGFFLLFDQSAALVGVILVFAAVLMVVFFIWVKLYYASMWYELRDDEMSWKRGVIFRTTGIVPYNRITNLDLRQGPVMRALGISTLSIQTAGYSGQAVPEIRIEAIVHAEELRELLRTMVRSCSGRGDGTGTGAPEAAPVGSAVNLQILEELKRIRMLLEQGR